MSFDTLSVKCYTLKNDQEVRHARRKGIGSASSRDYGRGFIIEKGYLNTTTQDIIDRVKISRGLLYYHFKNKEDILYRLIERYSEPMLRKLSSIAYDPELSAPEKIKAFIESTLVLPGDVTKEMTTLQKTVNLGQNRYLIDQFSHNFINKLTEYFSAIIEQGNSENVFHVAYPRETASFLVTGYVFVSNEVKAAHMDADGQNRYIAAFKAVLARTFGMDMNLFED